MAEFSLHHIHHEAADVDLAARFYVENFGGRITERTVRDGAQWARVAVGGAMLNISDRAEAAATRGLHRGYDHIGIHTTDFEETVGVLRANGVEFYIEPMSPRAGVDVAFITGPDDVKIEILSVSPE